MVPTDGTANEPPRRCGAAHLDDPSPCEGDREVVRIVIGEDEVLGCVHHGTRLYASVEHARVYPVGGPDGPNADAVLAVRRGAVGMEPFFWMVPAGPPERKPRHRLPGLHGFGFRRTS
ncbi:MAG TPA: hypothetical protein VFN97_02570 [Actinospica sp.]|nr:hypothetical protein [Actinospica sp.]